MAERTGYKIVVYLDDNPLSPTYMQTYEERTLDESTCPIPQDDLVLVSNECEVDESGYTGYRLEIYYNRTTGEYTEIRAEDPECIESSTDEQWVNSGSPYCETSEKGINTGYMLQLQVQMNPNLENYGETRNQRYKSPDCGGNDCAIWDDIQKQCHVAVIDCVATFDGTEDVNQIDINPLSATYNQTRTINKESNDCENCTDTFFSWIDVGTMCGDDDFLCGNGLQRVATNSYIVSQKYKMIGEKPPVPMDEYQIFLKIEDDEDCGYIRPQYSWQKAEGQYLCDYETYTKYEMYVRIVSYDAGITWSVVEPLETQRGEVISYDSYDCGKPMYRWVDNGEVVCEDNGDDGKIRYYSAFSNGEFSNLTSSVSCNENDTLTAAEVKSVTQTKYRRVGDCIRVIDESANVANGGYVSTPVVWLGDYTEDVGNITGYSGSCIDIPERVEKINTISRNAYFENIVMMPPYPISATSVFQGGSGLEDYCAIWVGADNYNQWANDAFWGNFDGRDNRTAKLLPMNNDTISWKARIHLKSNFNDWYYFIPDGEDETTITSEEGRYGRTIMTEIKLSDKIKTLTRNSFGSNNNGYRNFENLIAIDLGNGIERIENNVFNQTVNTIDSLTLPSSLTYVGYDALLGIKVNDLYVNCAAEWHGGVTYPDRVHVTNIQNILDNTFEYSYSSFFYSASTKLYIGDNLVTDLVIPSGTTSIGQYVFGKCSFNSVVIPSGVTVSENAFLGHINDAYLESMVKLPNVDRIHVSCGKLLEYNNFYDSNSGATMSELDTCSDSPYKDITLFNVGNSGTYGDRDEYVTFGETNGNGTVTYKVNGKTISLYRRTTGGYFRTSTICVKYDGANLVCWNSNDATDDLVYFSNTFDELSDGENTITIEITAGEFAYPAIAIPLNTSSQTRTIATLHQNDGTSVDVTRASNLIETKLKWADIESYSSTTSSITVYDCSIIEAINFDGMENLQTLVFTTATPPDMKYNLSISTKPYRIIVPCEYYPRYMNTYSEKNFADRIEPDSYDCLTVEWIVERTYCDTSTGKNKTIERKYLSYGDDVYKTDETRELYGIDCISITSNGYTYSEKNDYWKGGENATLDFEYLLDGGIPVTIYRDYNKADTEIYTENGTLIISSIGKSYKDIELSSHTRYQVRTNIIKSGGMGTIKFNI